jgi:hypothetical protein
MANCKRCQTKVGCGCQLVNGYCSACNYAVQQEIKEQENANAKAN